MKNQRHSSPRGMHLRNLAHSMHLSSPPYMTYQSLPMLILHRLRDLAHDENRSGRAAISNTNSPSTSIRLSAGAAARMVQSR